MYGITYRSKIKPNCPPEDILDILSASRRNNKEYNITGCLIYHKDTFIQILEGEKKDVKKIFKKIIHDFRHQEIALLWEGTCKERAFSAWNMAYHSLEGNQNTKEIVHFEQNLLALSSFSKMQSASVMLFWKNVEKLILGQKKPNF
jgi:hypothetical protein